jgi:hypothetical protein
VENAGGGRERKKTRKSGPKVKTGCTICKIRHIKCDEGRPQCGRCAKFEFECSYPPLVEKRKKGAVRPLARLRMAGPLKSGPRPVEEDGARMVWIGWKGVVDRGVATLRFERPDEERYFRQFVEKTSVEIGGAWESEYWIVMVLQLSAR